MYYCFGTTNFSVVYTELLEPKVDVTYTFTHVYILSKHAYTTTPCLRCTIRADQLKLPQHERGKLPPHIPDSLHADYLQFETTGKGDIRQAKNFNNVIGPVFFNVPGT